MHSLVSFRSIKSVTRFVPVPTAVVITDPTNSESPPVKNAEANAIPPPTTFMAVPTV